MPDRDVKTSQDLILSFTKFGGEIATSACNIKNPLRCKTLKPPAVPGANKNL
jgi:hypothetical protein